MCKKKVYGEGVVECDGMVEMEQKLTSSKNVEENLFTPLLEFLKNDQSWLKFISWRERNLLLIL